MTQWLLVLLVADEVSVQKGKELLGHGWHWSTTPLFGITQDVIIMSRLMNRLPRGKVSQDK